MYYVATPEFIRKWNKAKEREQICRMERAIWPWVEEFISVCYKWNNVYFGVDAWMPKYLKTEIIPSSTVEWGRIAPCGGPTDLPGKRAWTRLRDLD